ncbi:MAG: hypothetical protein JJU11_00100 [Candidatus Sumerlaeia bacterium]|nr:hypothetical protein [Candidatus Sumerlaeia bacterium]
MQSDENRQLSLFANQNTPASSSPEAPLKIGQIFTPLNWAKWLIAQSQVLSGDWSRKTFLDPTGGDGVFLIALAREYEELHGSGKLTQFVHQLFYVEVDTALVSRFKERFRASLGIEFPQSNIANMDFLLGAFPFEKVDVIVGNPPWMNFTDLPADYKESMKRLFDRYGMNPDRRRLLLGSSRVDISALVIVKALADAAKESCEYCFYAPLSLFLGDGAHDGFRRYTSLGRPFRVSQIWDFNGLDIFGGVSTRYCAFAGTVDKKQQYPIRYHILEDPKWVEYTAFPLKESNSQLRIHRTIEEYQRHHDSPPIRLLPAQRPRQGVNTCGANSVYIFEDMPQHIPPAFLYPLVGGNRKAGRTSHRYILIPHHANGKPLHQSELEKYPAVWEYLLSRKKELSNRKGVLIQSWIRKGYWWALLGVGPYSFAPYKVLWKALGAKTFEPEIYSCLDGRIWQGNQALHAFIPCWNPEEAQEVRQKMRSPQIADCLASLRMEGSRNWAQPGKISKLISFEEEPAFFS